jgi:integrase
MHPRRRQRATEQRPVDAPPETVCEAVLSYLADRTAEGQDTARATVQLAAHVLPTWGARRIAALTAPELKRWRDELVITPPRRRRARQANESRSTRSDPGDAEQRRRRRSTVNRITTTFKAALNHAARLHPGAYPNQTAWHAGLKAFRKVDSPRDRWLTNAEIVRLLAACPTDFGRLVGAAVYTGCRYGELCRALVGHYDGALKTLRVPVTKSGRGRDVFLNDEAAVFFAMITANRSRDEWLLARTPTGPTPNKERGVPHAGLARCAPWGPNHQARRIKEACHVAEIKPPISFHGLRHSYASLAVQSGMTLIALARNLGHTDTRMVEKHYGHLSDHYLREQVRRFAPAFGLE